MAELSSLTAVAYRDGGMEGMGEQVGATPVERLREAKDWRESN